MFIVLVLVKYAALLVSLVFHEYMHAFTAHVLGDETANRAGRLTLNPVAHADLVGTVVLPLAALTTGLPVFGWAKPVPYNPNNLRNQKWGPLMVGLAGPLSNFGLAALFLTALKVCTQTLLMPSQNLLVIFLLYLSVVNIVLGVFNFIPVPPLDGAQLLDAALDSPKYARLRYNIQTQGPKILMIVVFIDLLSPFSILGWVFNGVISAAFSLFGLS